MPRKFKKINLARYKGILQLTGAGLATLLAVAPLWGFSIITDLGQRTIEDAYVQITLYPDNTGYVVANCTSCLQSQSLKLSLDAQSIALLNYIQTTFTNAAEIGYAYRSVTYDPNTMRLVKLSIVNQ